MKFGANGIFASMYDSNHYSETLTMAESPSLVHCPYNPRHMMKRKHLSFHISVCPDNYELEVLRSFSFRVDSYVHRPLSLSSGEFEKRRCTSVLFATISPASSIYSFGRLLRPVQHLDPGFLVQGFVLLLNIVLFFLVCIVYTVT